LEQDENSQSSEKFSDYEGEKTLHHNRTSVQDSAEVILASNQGNSTANIYALAMFEEEGRWCQRRRSSRGEGGDFAQPSVDDNSPSKAEEDEKQGGDVVDANADNKSRSSVEC